MRTIVFLAMFVGVHCFAQISFGYDAEDDTLLPSFRTTLEADAYAVARAQIGSAAMYLRISDHPLTLRFWSPKAGWDVIVFYADEGRVDGYLFDISGEAESTFADRHRRAASGDPTPERERPLTGPFII